MTPDSGLPKKWLTTAEVGQMLSFDAAYVRELAEGGFIRSVVFNGRRRILPEWVDEFVAGVVSQQEGKQ